MQKGKHWDQFYARVLLLMPVMCAHNRMAVCTYVRTRNSEPRLVALVAAQEEKDDYGEQVQSTASSVFSFSLAPPPKTLHPLIHSCKLLANQILPSLPKWECTSCQRMLIGLCRLGLNHSSYCMGWELVRWLLEGFDNVEAMRTGVTTRHAHVASLLHR